MTILNYIAMGTGYIFWIAVISAFAFAAWDEWQERR